MNGKQIENYKKTVFAPLSKSGADAEKVILELQQALFPVLILKNERKLKKALVKIETIRDEKLPQIGTPDLHHLAKRRGIQSMILVAELVIKASLLRRESRASHYREDFPDRDDNNWLKWIMANQTNGELHFRFEPVPLTGYKHKTWQYYSDNFNFTKRHEGF